jgi:hypothetical protein
MNRFAPFVYDAWKNPETLAIVSQVAGIDLTTEMDFEIAHINISVKSQNQKEEELQAIDEKASTEADEGIAGCPWEDDKPIVDWHTDSYPFVCVVMLSDCTNMIGGETALRTGTGDIFKVRSPQMVRSSITCDMEHLLSAHRAVLPFYKGVISNIKLYGLWARRNASPWSHHSDREVLTYGTIPS